MPQRAVPRQRLVRLTVLTWRRRQCCEHAYGARVVNSHSLPAVCQATAQARQQRRRRPGLGVRAGQYFIYHSPPWSVTAVRSAIPLLENGPSAPVEEALRYRFSNRHPQTETLGLGLEYRVNKPVPLALIGTGWKNQPVPLRLPR